MKPIPVLHQKLLGLRRRLAARRATRALQADQHLWQDLAEYTRNTQSTGCGYIDYHALYRHVREQKPREVLECGTGTSTLVIAAALMRNAEEGSPAGRVTSMEEHAAWFELANKLLPERYRTCAELHLSPVVEDHISLFRGNRYRDVPARPYDFVFVDGPAYDSPLDGAKTCDLDYLHLVRQSDRPVAALIDKRVSTVFVCQRLLGAKVRYEAWTHLAHIAPSCRTDLQMIDPVVPSRTFARSFSVLGNTRMDWPH